MEVGAIAFLGVAGIEDIAMAPACSGLVVAHGGENVVVDGTGFIKRLSLALGDFSGQVGGKASDRDESIGLQVLVFFCWCKRRGNQAAAGLSERNSLMAYHIVFHIEVQFGLGGIGLGVVELVPIF